ncbi:MAG: pyridoxal phosphate-dependent aminotransferase [Anaerolineales bacterium]|nr:pyridoxal phosphate-dependent aminotransferase [Anaerolineales bacterium]
MAKFPPNEIISLLDVNLKFNLAESTATNLTFGKIVDDAFLAKLKELELGYGTSRGYEPLRNEIARRTGILADNVLITNGAAGSIFLTAFSLCSLGDEVVTVTPNFPPTMDIISALGATKQVLPLSFDEGYRLSVERLASVLSDQTRLVVFVTPHNPSGTSTPRKNLEAAINLIEEKCPKAYILIDETYREATYGDNQAAVSMAGFSPRVLTTTSLSKCHGAPGIRLGWLTCNDAELLEQLALAKMNTVISCSVMDELVGLHILKNSQGILDKRKALLQKGVTIVEGWVQKNAEFIEWIRPSAGALCCVRLKLDMFSDAAVDAFYTQAGNHQVQLASGEWFGEQKRVFRLGFGFLPIPLLEEALSLLEGILRKTKAA